MMAQPVEFHDILTKRSEALRKEKFYKPIKDLKDSIKRIKLRKSLKNALKKENDVSLICEYKPASPSLGHISDLKVEDVIPK